MALVKARTFETEGTCLQGYLHTDYDTLVAKLGAPNRGGDKVRVQWRMKLNGVVFTIYDWKTTGSLEHVNCWNIGGESKRAVDAVREIFGYGNAHPWR